MGMLVTSDQSRERRPDRHRDKAAKPARPALKLLHSSLQAPVLAVHAADEGSVNGRDLRLDVTQARVDR